MTKVDFGHNYDWVGKYIYVPFQQYMTNSLIHPDKRERRI
jgi:hypothetical protein